MVEVMAVIAVTSTLGVMLVSSIKSSKDLALQVSCMSNVSQIRTVAEMHRKDFGKLPYSDTWLTDFSFASSYLGEDNSLSIFNCPVAEDKPVTSYSQLSNSTSYYYVPDAKQLIQNIEDGQKVGLLSSEIEQLSQIQDGAIYDKSPSHHNGKVNIAHLFKDDENKANLDGALAGSVGNTKNYNNLPSLDGANLVDLPQLLTSTTTTTTTDSSSSSDKAKSNNGHGNNVDGVDSSNPGNSKQGQDSDPTVDDESKGGSSTTTTESNSSSETKTNNGKKK